MRIGVDAACWTNGRGYGRFDRELVGAMLTAAPTDEFVFVAEPHLADRLPVEAPDARLPHVQESEVAAMAAAPGPSRPQGDTLRISGAVARERPEAIFFPSSYSYFPQRPGQRGVGTVHDAIVERHPKLTGAPA